MPSRCSWVTNDPEYQAYHDLEWGRELKSDQQLFEQLILEGAQAGLSWLTVLKKRENYRTRFHAFDITRCASLSDEQLEAALVDKGIIRHRLKVYGVRKNAIAAQQLISEFGSLHSYFWHWIDHQPIINNFDSIADYPTKTALSDKISKDLKKRGFTFVGSTITYAFMQAVGMTIDHSSDCFLAQPIS